MNKITIILPTYKEPKYLDVCIESIYKTQTIENDIIVVVDGFYELNKWVLDKYKDYSNFKTIILPENKGLAFAQNIAVHYTKTDKILIVNDDNVFPQDWDKLLNDDWNVVSKKLNNDNFFLVPNQIEPIQGIFDMFIRINFASNTSEFNLDKFLIWEQDLRKEHKHGITHNGWTLPIFMNRMDYLKVGGWDLYYNSPHFVDLDFFYKLQLVGIDSYRTHSCNFYHFAHKATKNVDGNKKQKIKKDFEQLEQVAGREFIKKWGFFPKRNPDNNFEHVIIDNI